MKIEKFKISDTGTVLISEEYMEELLEREGFVISEDGWDVDSTLTCDYAIDLGFNQLGDFGNGFIFEKKLEEIKNEGLGKYLKRI